MTFRDRLLATLRAVEPVLEVPGVLVAGSEVPNLLELNAAATVEIDGLRIPLPQPAGLALEKLVSDRTGEKGDRDLLVVAGLLASMTLADVDELERSYRRLPTELRHQVRSNLSILSLLEARTGMPDPHSQRAAVDALLRRMETP